AAADAIRAADPDARVGIALNLSPCDPASDAPADADAAARMDGYLNRWFLDPLFGRRYPKDMLELYRPYFARGGELDGSHRARATSTRPPKRSAKVFRSVAISSGRSWTTSSGRTVRASASASSTPTTRRSAGA